MSLFKIAEMQKEALGEGNIWRFTDVWKQKNIDRARRFAAEAKVEEKYLEAALKRGEKYPMSNYLIGGGIGDIVGGYVGKTLKRIQARKAAYSAEHPGLSLVPFVGWGSAGEKALQRALSKGKSSKKRGK